MPDVPAISVNKTINSKKEVVVTIKYTIPDMPNNMLSLENGLQATLNQTGSLITEDLLASFDYDGSPFQIGTLKYTSCGIFPQTYETPYGPVTVERHMYQSQNGGRRLCPLENRARMVDNSTPKYAQMISSKMASMSGPAVKRDLCSNHGRSISLDYIKSLTDQVGEMALAKEGVWTYQDGAAIEGEISTISVGLDGTCMFLQNGGGWREAMVGTLSLYDGDGERQHTIYLGAVPEYGKEKFLDHLEFELDKAAAKRPNAAIQGLADGAGSNWNWLNARTDYQVLDFYHLSEYVGKAASALFKPSQEEEKEEWLTNWLHKIKHSNTGAMELRDELNKIKKGKTGAVFDTLNRVAEYLDNQKDRTKYLREIKANRPIGSGVTEAACKTLIKQRMCKAGMRWKIDGAANVIALRSLILTEGRWDAFWNKIMKYGNNGLLLQLSQNGLLWITRPVHK
jgi:hypothetical protein